MPGQDSSFARKFPESLSLRLVVAQAAAVERVQDAYVQGGVVFVETVRGWLTLGEAVEVFLGEVSVPRSMAEEVHTRLLARVDASKWDREVAKPRLTGADLARPARWLAAWQATRTMRKATDAVVKLAAARAEDLVLRAHVQNGAHFVEILKDVVWAPEAVSMYLGSMDLHAATANVVYQRTLAELAPATLAAMPSAQEALELAFPKPPAPVPPASSAEAVV